MIPVILESPYAGRVSLHLRYLRACMRDSLLRGEAPYASHHLYTAPGVLRDELAAERDRGILAGFAWRALAHKTVFYVDLGWSTGMELAREATISGWRPYEIRELGDDWLDAQLEREAHAEAPEHWFRSCCAL
jgi:hypothetical protein